MAEDKMIVTPWEVKGEIDYDKLVKDFGLGLIDDKLLKRLEKYMGDNFFLRRKIFFAQRDLEFVLNEYEKGNKFYLYNGRGPSGHTHIGHLLSFMFAKQMQEAFKVKYLIQLTDDEKFMFKDNLELEDVEKFTYENALDIIALGFDPESTKIISDLKYAKTLYRQAIRVAKKLTYSTTKAVFGFTNDTNVGSIFFTSMQSVPAFIESVKQKKNVPCLIPHGIDQDPHFRISRDILPKLGYYKPASIECKFTPGLAKGGKMSASEPDSAIFTVDSPKEIERKVMKAFTGGKDTIEEQKKTGGYPEVCSVYQYYYSLFEQDDEKLKERYDKCKKGKIMCGECKKELAERIKKFLAEHQKKRESAKKVIDKFMLED
ncbi:MAG: tryptophan--tRNA ligase [Candidatus Aenigmatarchaeota archaeon]